MDKHLHTIDLSVGSRLKMRRKVVGLSQEQLGIECDLTYQQIQKYENGLNRISASRLAQIARILNVKVEYFFDHEDEDKTEKEFPGGLLSKKETLRLIRAFYKIKDMKQRDSIIGMIEAFSKEPINRLKA
jgi:transcriptional regulator with XRE-family HTH domain